MTDLGEILERIAYKYAVEIIDAEELRKSVTSLTAERDKLLEDIKDRDRTYLAVQRAEGLERDRLAAEVARQRRINDGWAEEHAKRMAEMARQSRFWGALEETAARLEAHQHIMCSECEGIRLFVASALGAWE